AWRRRPGAAEVLGAVLGAGVLTIAVHLYQALNALLNLTMTRPLEFTPLRYYHAIFMWTELSFVFFFWGQVALVGKENPRAILSQRIGFVILSSALFLRLLFPAYGSTRYLVARPRLVRTRGRLPRVGLDVSRDRHRGADAPAVPL